MSMDNGHVVRKTKDGKFVLQMYFASAAGFPEIPDEGITRYDTLEAAVREYARREELAAEHGYPLDEYGLTFDIDASDGRKLD